MYFIMYKYMFKKKNPYCIVSLVLSHQWSSISIYIILWEKLGFGLSFEI